MEETPGTYMTRSYSIMSTDLTNMSEGADHNYQTDWRKFTKLEAIDRPGLTEVEFIGLFVKCNRCKLITTRPVFTHHYCSPPMADVGDLTDEE